MYWPLRGTTFAIFNESFQGPLHEAELWAELKLNYLPCAGNVPALMASCGSLTFVLTSFPSVQWPLIPG